MDRIPGHDHRAMGLETGSLPRVRDASHERRRSASYQPAGFPRFCSSSHVLSGAKYSAMALASISR
jgi:hypothetical protein